jgi:uncharacterized protein YndB with AHSA1/START domain
VIRDSILVDAPIERVWSALATPANLPKWNPNAVSVSGGESPVREGSQFWIRYRLGARETACHAEVTVLVPQARLEFVLTSDRMPQGASITEKYALAAAAGGVRVTQEVHRGKSGAPWWAIALISVLQRVGRPTGRRFLEQFKQLIETASLGGAPPPR